jgi:N-acetylglucosamine kinase-like BadF-type ATPase
MVVLGLDAGGTRTLGWLADERGQIVAEARGPGANLQASGELEVEKVLHQVIDDAIGDRHVRPSAICLGMAGVDRPRDAATVRGILSRIGHRARVLVVNDALIALEAGLPDAPGIVLIAGTGSIAYGRDGQGRAARAGGWGYVLGDEGSGYWLGRHALRAVVRAADGRGPATALAAQILAHYQVSKPDELVHEIYYGGMRPRAIAALSREVQAAADAGDEVATSIIDQGARELAAAAIAVAHRLAFVSPTVILSGGTLHGIARLRERVGARLAEELPGVTVRLLDVEPAQGAVRLARALLSGRATVPAYVDSLTTESRLT